MKVYVVQMEEGSGIPGSPELYTDKDEADRTYKERWAEALNVDGPGEPPYTRAEFDKDWDTRQDFESDFWPPDGGVRMFVEDLAGVELEPGDCAECGDPADAHLWHNDISHTFSQ
jgi:hypothetical protein